MYFLEGAPVWGLGCPVGSSRTRPILTLLAQSPGASRRQRAGSQSRGAYRSRALERSRDRPASGGSPAKARVRQSGNKRMSQRVECLAVSGATLALASNDTPHDSGPCNDSRNCADKPLPPLRGWQAREGNTGALPIPRGLWLSQISRSPCIGRTTRFQSFWSKPEEAGSPSPRFPIAGTTRPEPQSRRRPSRIAPYQSPCAFSRSLETSSAVNGSRSARSSSRLRRGSTAETGLAAI